MISSDLGADPGGQAWVALRPNNIVESFFSGWTEMYGGANWRGPGLRDSANSLVDQDRAHRHGDHDLRLARWRELATLVNGAFANMPATAYTSAFA